MHHSHRLQEQPTLELELLLAGLQQGLSILVDLAGLQVEGDCIAADELNICLQLVQGAVF